MHVLKSKCVSEVDWLTVGRKDNESSNSNSSSTQDEPLANRARGLDRRTRSSVSTPATRAVACVLKPTLSRYSCVTRKPTINLKRRGLKILLKRRWPHHHQSCLNIRI